MDINDILHTHHDDISNQLGHYTTATTTAAAAATTTAAAVLQLY